MYYYESVSDIYIYKQKAKEKQNIGRVYFFGTAGQLEWRLGVVVLVEVFVFGIGVLGMM